MLPGQGTSSVLGSRLKGKGQESGAVSKHVTVVLKLLKGEPKVYLLAAVHGVHMQESQASRGLTNPTCAA